MVAAAPSAADRREMERSLVRIARRPRYIAIEGEVPLEADSRPRCRYASRVALLAAAGLVVWWKVSAGSAVGRLRSQLYPIQEYARWRGVAPCGLLEHGVEYWTRTKNLVGQYTGIATEAECRFKCFLVAECHIWTLLPNGECTLKSLEQDEAPNRHLSEGATSGGMPCQMHEMHSPGSLYCWALMQPSGYEKELLAMQYKQHISLFSCEEYAVYSNAAVPVVDGLFSEVVNTSLTCASGGEFGTALNLYIFIAVWNRVVDIGRYASHDWTVKVDPDTVFFAMRLRSLLPHHPEEARGVYLNNCKFGMHGPLEVFSRNAVNALSRSWQLCQDDFTAMCHGDCQWGEDMFIDQCLQKVANVRRDDEWSLLVEDHCTLDASSPGPFSYYECDGTHVAFHPFKDQVNYDQCLSNAVALESQLVLKTQVMKRRMTIA